MKICWAQYLLWLVIAALALGSMLPACGQKGPLYLPDETVQQPAGQQDERQKEEEE